MNAAGSGALSDAVLAAGLCNDRPTYVYDLKIVRDRCREIERIPVPGLSIFFATMANDHQSILNCIRLQGHGVFVNSPRHLRLAREQGFDSSRIIYAATNMTDEEMNMCVRLGVRVIVDSLGQLRRFCALAGYGREVGLRLSIGSALDGKRFWDDPSYRFGLLLSELPGAIGIARDQGVRITGAHSYFGTDICSATLLATALERLVIAADVLPDLQYLDVGGGFGTTQDDSVNSLDMPKYGALVAAIMRRAERRRARRLELILEPGRYLVASCGSFFVRVVDIKMRPDRIFVGTNGSIAIFPRPLLYPERAHHRCEIVGLHSSRPAAAPVYVCGNSTYSRDFLARDLSLPLPKIGDTLVFHDAGAYCRSMITDFLGKDRPDEVVIDTAAASSSELELVGEIAQNCRASTGT